MAVILFVDFVVGERTAFCFSLDRFQLWVGALFKPEASVAFVSSISNWIGGNFESISGGFGSPHLPSASGGPAAGA